MPNGTREEPGTLTQGGALFFLVTLVWESNPTLQGGWCKPNHQPIGGSDPNHQGIWSPPRAGLRVYLKEGTYHTRLFRGPSTNGMKKWDGTTE